MDLFKKPKPKAPRTPFTDPKHDYANATLWSDFKERIKRRTLKGERIYIEMVGYVEIIDGEKVQKCRRLDRWTEDRNSDLRYHGYTKVINFPGYDSLIWWNVPVYLKLINFHQFDVHKKDEYGRYLYSQDTAGTLHDEMVSTATHDFLKGLFKTSLPAIDLQKLGLIAILGIGAIFGLMMMGVI